MQRDAPGSTAFQAAFVAHGSEATPHACRGVNPLSLAT
jgi:hypothetical protein